MKKQSNQQSRNTVYDNSDLTGGVPIECVGDKPEMPIIEEVCVGCAFLKDVGSYYSPDIICTNESEECPYQRGEEAAIVVYDRQRLSKIRKKLRVPRSVSDNTLYQRVVRCAIKAWSKRLFDKVSQEDVDFIRSTS